VCAIYFPDFEPVLPQQKSQLRDVRGLPLPIDDQANQFIAKFSFSFPVFIKKFLNQSLSTIVF